MSFLPQAEGYYDEAVDFIFLRHSLEHSPYPIFTLVEYNRVLKQHGYIYIEVPAPDCDRLHEYNLNHYSILGQHQLAALLKRTGFELHKFDIMEFDLTFPDKATIKEMGKGDSLLPQKEATKPKGKSKKAEPEKDTIMREKFYCILASKQRPIDIK
jgi:ubiquinone/menaquinone biosynthesis C-methylase UbiE